MKRKQSDRQIAFLSMDDLGDFVIDDEIAILKLKALQIHVESIDWRASGIDWGQFEFVVIRSTWNYQQFQTEFMRVLNTIENSAARLLNSLKIVTWNIDKRYLKELEHLDIPIVPTEIFDHFDAHSLDSSINALNSPSFVLKPTISANADNTFLVTKSQWQANTQPHSQMAKVFQNRSFILQPFVHSIQTQGEYSLFFIDGQLTHAISKRPKPGDFRVQEEHGGWIETIEPDKELIRLATSALDTLPDAPLYARLDYVNYLERWCVMEVELIEPSLYFRFSEFAADRFAAAIVRRLNESEHRSIAKQT